MPKSRPPSVQEILLAHHGVPHEEVRWRIYCGVFSAWSRFRRNTRLYFGADPFDAEYRFVLQLAEARSPSDVERAFGSYRDEVARQSRLTRLFVRTWPSRKRTVQYLQQVRSPFAGGMGNQAADVREATGA